MCVYVHMYCPNCVGENYYYYNYYYDYYYYLTLEMREAFLSLVKP